MTDDVISQKEHLFLGSRLKRLAERMQGDVVKVAVRAGLPIQPSHYPVLATIDGASDPLTIGDIAEALALSQPAITRIVSKLDKMGVLAVTCGADRRQREVALTERGHRIMLQSRTSVWPQIESAVQGLLSELPGDFLKDISAIEKRLDDRPLEARTRDTSFRGLSIVNYDDSLAAHFRDVNAEWIEDMYQMEKVDRDTLDQPRKYIIDPGGDILFVNVDGLGIVGTCALKKTAEGQFELTKMGVLSKARGRKAGEFLLAAAIAHAKTLGATRLYLLTNRKSAAAIHLYEKLGFTHDEGIMSEFGGGYARCDVAMLYTRT